jgi:hypothetical protein
MDGFLWGELDAEARSANQACKSELINNLKQAEDGTQQRVDVQIYYSIIHQNL